MTNRLHGDDMTLFTLIELQKQITDHVKAVRVELAQRLRTLSDEHYAKALVSPDACERAQFEGMGEAFAASAALVHVSMLEEVKS